MTQIYLDYNATAPIRPEVLTLVTQVMGEVGNASSVHSYGRQARKYVEEARQQASAYVMLRQNKLFLPVEQQKALTTVLSGYRHKRVLISATEHPAVIAAAPHAEIIPVTANGLVDMEAYKKILSTNEPPALVSVMLVNSETGVIQPIAEMAQLAHKAEALFHTDAVQAAGRIDISLDALNVDYMSLSAHKMAGPQGVGAIVIREGLELPKFMLGGGQEKNCRAGTHNTAGIAGMGLAAKLALENIHHYGEVQKLRDDMESKIRKMSNNIVIYGDKAPRVGNTCNIGLKDVSAQTQMMALDLDGIAVSSGSACSSGSFKASHVLTAMGANENAAKSALRISMGWATISADIDAFLESYQKIIQNTKKQE